ncbi:M48 family metallopeptidase [Altererythrobacter sp. RZ02]|uniref:M48 family metallopeptidase n=1 Tax=Pontixanthobacter rizhaonensis TaxID=2730337 RepID=A0A848QIF6_9SPHN|nr:SprT family zinc-dependent metalloprotease [Pontixanthobacter rizhaonensis]NMW30453.1 M48 family metallopeptidase [Pontixanthobacter rizhaonensis]
MNIERQNLSVGGIDVEVVRKPIKNLHLGVYPPSGRVRVAVPPSVNDEAIRLAVVTRMGWIKRQRNKFEEQARQSARAYVSGETHYYFGVPYRMRLVRKSGGSMVSVAGDRIELSVPANADRDFRERAFQRWQRDRLRERVEPLVGHWSETLGVQRPKAGIKRMRTKWGSCNPIGGRVWINLEMAKKPPACLDYLVCHELAHFIERSHGDRFIALLDRYLPNWRTLRDELNREPLAHEEWSAGLA